MALSSEQVECDEADLMIGSRVESRPTSCRKYTRGRPQRPSEVSGERGLVVEA